MALTGPPELRSLLRHDLGHRRLGLSQPEHNQLSICVSFGYGARDLSVSQALVGYILRCVGDTGIEPVTSSV